MKFITYAAPDATTRIGLVHEDRAIDLAAASGRSGKTLPPTLEDVIIHQDEYLGVVRQIDTAFRAGDFAEFSVPLDSLTLLAPITRPASCRDGYAFRQHVSTARRNRGVEMIPEFDQYPIFYFTNHNAIFGPGPIPVMKDHLDKLDFELEAAVVIGRVARNIEAKDADAIIFGYTIMNDWSARTLQMEEMKLNLGPAKGKDFATSIGPMLVTPDELAAFATPAPAGHVGAQFGLKMKARVNGVQVSEGSMGDMDWTFAEIIERCAYGTNVLPTDVIGSGTVGTGCFLELNGTAKLENPDAIPQWLKPGDRVELEIDGLGTLVNTIAYDGDFSIRAKKHGA